MACVQGNRVLMCGWRRGFRASNEERAQEREVRVSKGRGKEEREGLM